MDVIVSRYAKNVDWTNNLVNCNIFIYDKSDDENDYIKLPNIGREPHTFLYHILLNYENLGDYCCFLQDNPFDHMNINEIYTINNYSLDLDFYPLGNWRLNPSIDYDPTCPWCDVKNLIFNKYFINHPQIVNFTAGGQFIVKKSAILNRKKIFYKKLIEEIYRTDIIRPDFGDNKMPWVYERVWSFIFNRNFKTIYDK